jgi:LysM repeat protein
MNNPNPFVPQGSLLEQEKRRSRMKLGVFCVLAVGVCGLTAMLIQGCKRETADNTPPPDTNIVSNTETNPSPAETSNAAFTVPPVPTNPAPVVVQPVDTATTEYTVVEHDTLGKIAKAHGVTLKALEAANPGVVPKKLKVGQKLQIPPATSATAAPVTSDATAATTGGEEIYKVQSGDTLTKIAKQYGVGVKAIESENSLSTTKIKVGQKLKIPAKAEAPNPVAAAPATAAPVNATTSAPSAMPAR